MKEGDVTEASIDQSAHYGQMRLALYPSAAMEPRHVGERCRAALRLSLTPDLSSAILARGCEESRASGCAEAARAAEAAGETEVDPIGNCDPS